MIKGLHGVLVLALCCASLVLFGSQLRVDAAEGFSRSNLMPFVTRMALVRALVVGAGIGLVLGLACLAIGRNRVAVPFWRIGRVMSPLVLVGFVPPLLMHDPGEPLYVVLAVTVFILVFERLLRLSFGELFGSAGSPATASWTGRRPRRVGLALVVAGAAFYAMYMSKYTVFMHRRFETMNFDLGQYDNIFWTTLHGHPLRCTPLGLLKDWDELSNHADLSVFFLLPFYAIRPNAETLLILQSTILGLGAIPLYLFAVRRLSPFYAVLLCFCYLLYPPMHGANFYDFHFQPVSSTFVMLTIWLVDARRWFWCALSFIVALGCREDVSMGLTALGLFLFLTGYRPRAGAIMAAVAGTYFGVMRFYVMPKFGQGWFSEIYKELYPVPDGPHTFAGVITTLLTNPYFVFRSLLTPEKLRYLLQIATPVALLPLRRTYLVPVLVPAAILTLLTTAYPFTLDIAFQYAGHFIPYIFAGAAVVLATYRFSPRARVELPAAACAVLAGTLLCTKQWGAFPPTHAVKGGFIYVGFTKPTEADAQKARDLAELAAMIPKGAKYAVSEQELPHVSGSMDVLMLRDGVGAAEYLLYGFGSIGDGVGNKALESGDFVEVARRPPLILLKKKTAP